MLIAHAPVGLAVIAADERIRFANQAFGRLIDVAPEDLVGLPLAGLLHAEERAPALAAVRRLLEGPAGESILTLRRLRRVSPGAALQLRMTALRGQDGTVEGVLACAVPLGEVQPAEAPEPGASRDTPALRTLRRRCREFVALHRLAQLLAGAPDAWPALERALALTRALFRATAVVIALVDIGRDEDFPPVALEAPWLVRVRPTAFGADGAGLLERRRPLLAHIQGGDARPLPADLCAYLGLADCTSLMLLPLYDDQRETFGVLAIGARRTRRPYRDPDLELAVRVARLVAGALHGERLLARAQRSAAHEERARLVGRLHDSAFQSLYSMMLLAEGWAQSVGQGGGPDAAELMRELGAIAQETLVDLRRLTGT